MNWAPRLGRIRGIDIRFHLSAAALVAYLLIDLTRGWGLDGLPRAGVVVSAFLATILGHELGHAWAARRSHLPVNGIVFWALGGECQIVGAMPSPRAELFVSVGGPAAHALLLAAGLAPVLLAGGVTWQDIRFPLYARSLVTAAWAFSLWLLLFNLLPAFPMDFGKVLRAGLVFRLGEVRATVVAARTGQVIAVTLFAFGMWTQSVLCMGLAVWIFLDCEQELRAVMHTGRVYDPGSGRPFFQSLGIQEDWAREAADDRPAAGKPPGFFRRWRERRSRRQAAREAERRQRLQAEVDRLLEKVSREGLPSLTAEERRTLTEAGEAYKRKQNGGG